MLFVLDASGSMYEVWEGKTRMDIAKEILSKMVDSLKSTPNLEIALRVYGHEWHKRYQNCKDTKLEVSFGSGNHELIKKKLLDIKPNGTTLIAYTLEQSGNDFPPDPNSRNVLILLTDGIEVCGGDPCAVSLALQKRNIILTPFIIGIGPEENFAKELGCIGTYYDASKVSDFQSNLNKIINYTLAETKIRVDLLDIYQKPTETNVNMTLTNSITGKTVHDIVHYIKPDGQSEELSIDALISYDIIVNTIPKVERKGITLEAGKLNVIKIPSPQGVLNLNINYKEYNTLKAIVRKAGSAETLHVQEAGKKEKYLTGEYDIELLTLPRIIYKNVKIEQSKNTTLTIPPPGILNVNDQIEGFGSIYEINSSGKAVWVCNFSNSRMSLTLQPGKYKLVFRSEKSTGSRFTDVQPFTINSGGSTLLKLYKK
ncbi:MAG: vWA domain-containing protein [Cytophagaceae bacterium]